MKTPSCPSLLTVIMLVVGGGCGSEDPTGSGASEVRQAGDAEVPQTSDAGSGAEECPRDDLARFYWSASQVTSDYGPLKGGAMIRAADIIARGRVKLLSAGRPRDLQTDASDPRHSTFITVEVDKSYKGATAVGDTLYLEVPRAEPVTDALLADLSKRIPDEVVTLFVTSAAWNHENRNTSSSIPKGAALHHLVSPQAFVVSSSCGLVQPFASEPVFADETQTAAQLDAAITALVSGAHSSSGCEVEPGSELDVASEPNWRSYADYAPWTNASGCLVRIDVLAERPGPEHCDWGDTRVLITGRPLGARYTSPGDTDHFVRDPNGSYGNHAFVSGFDADATLPGGARDTGYRSGDVALWVDPADPSAVYVVRPDGVERWPRGDPPLCS